MGEKWADYLVTAVKYDDNRKIKSVRQHKDNGDELDEGMIIDRDTLVSNIKHGVHYATVFNTKSNWLLGNTIKCFKVGSSTSIRTDLNKAKYDFLSMLPELE